MIDPVGFALENFDQTGRWRDVDPSMAPLDVSGSLPDGTAFTNLTEFRAALLSPPERFAGAVTEKLLTYALGRGLEYYDMPAVRAITRAAAGRRVSVILVDCRDCEECPVPDEAVTVCGSAHGCGSPVLESS